MSDTKVGRLLLVGGLLLLAASGAAPQGVPAGSATPGAADRRSTRDVVLAVARRQVRVLADGEYKRGTWDDVKASADPRGVEWVYPWGVTLLGMLRASEATGDPELVPFVLKHNEIVARYWRYLAWVQSTFEGMHGEDVAKLIRASPIRRVMRISSLDIAGAMSAQMVESFLRHGAKPTPEQVDLLRSTTDWVAKGQSRLPDGTFWRPETNQTLWIDDLFMSGSLLTRWSEYTRNQAYLDDAARQVLGMAKRQQDADGLWFHANFIAENATSPYKWGRANGWAMVATAEILSLLPETHPDRPRLLEVFRKHVDGIKPLQAPSGLWRQVLDHPELWEEMSCTGMFTFSIARAVRRGWIPRENLRIAQKAFAGMMRNVTEDGQVSETSEGTLIGKDLEYYVNRKRPLNDMHSPGPVLLAGTELLLAER